MKNLIKKYVDWRQRRIDARNRRRLTNHTPTLVCSNCTGGLLYHWLGLEFRSPFINLYLDNEDFITALENFDEFMDTPLVEDKESGKDYPVGIGAGGVRVHFMHYSDFDSAVAKWEQRKARMNRDNMAVMWTNFTPEPDETNVGGGIYLWYSGLTA